MNGDICTWHREIDINPPGLPDTGKLSRKTPAFILEEGVFQPYVEEWERIDDGAAGRLVLRRERALLVQVGRHVLRATPPRLTIGLRPPPASSVQLTPHGLGFQFNFLVTTEPLSKTALTIGR